jgi:hypothetical protein
MALEARDLCGLVLVRDALDADGAFVLTHALRLALGPAGGGRAAVLVAARHSAAHYQQALRRAGLPMPELVEAGRLAVVDALHRARGGEPPPPLDLRALLRRAARAAAGLGAGSAGAADGARGAAAPLCLVVDDLTALHCAAAVLADWPAFLHGLAALGAGAPGGALVALAHGDVGADEPWLARLEAAAALVLEVEPLRTGQSAEVSGRVRARRRDAPRGGDSGPGAGGRRLDERLVYYRLEGGGARFLGQVHG